MHHIILFYFQFLLGKPMSSGHRLIMRSQMKVMFVHLIVHRWQLLKWGMHETLFSIMLPRYLLLSPFQTQPHQTQQSSDHSIFSPRSFFFPCHIYFLLFV